MDSNSPQIETNQENNINLQPSSSFKKVLVAIDNLITSTEIFEQAVDLAEQFKGNLLICHCLQDEIPNTPEMLSLSGIGNVFSPEIWELQEQSINEASSELLSWMKSLQQKAEEKGIQAESTYLIGNPGEEICKLAREWQADIVVMGRRGLSGFSEILFGSVSNYVLHHSPCAVLVVQHQEENN